jgi:hypothetical protein
MELTETLKKMGISFKPSIEIRIDNLEKYLQFINISHFTELARNGQIKLKKLKNSLKV